MKRNKNKEEEEKEEDVGRRGRGPEEVEEGVEMYGSK